MTPPPDPQPAGPDFAGVLFPKSAAKARRITTGQEPHVCRFCNQVVLRTADGWRHQLGVLDDQHDAWSAYEPQAQP